VARLERQGTNMRAKGKCASILSLKRKKGIKTIFNHFRNTHARYSATWTMQVATVLELGTHSHI
jgi:hypothetical protein